MTRHQAYRAGLVVSAVLSLAAVASAADCPVEKALYVEPDAGFSVQFEPAVSESSPLSHRFAMTVEKAGLTLDGHVIFDEDAARPMGMAMHQCPEGDLTGDDLRACIVWEGVIYAAGGSSTIDILPPEGSVAPESLLLSGFGAAVRRHPIFEKTGAVPWDVFSFKGCAS